MLKNTYRTSLSKSELYEWLDRKAAQRQGFLIKMRVYKTKKTADGFRIRKIKTAKKFEKIPPRISARLLAPGKLQITVSPNRTGLVVFFVLPALFITLLSSFQSGDIVTKLLAGLFFFFPILALLNFVLVFWPMYGTRKWIERELNLDREKP
ncbi:hypothetical protein HUK80_02575 [Flavobacterium sp. MAH-1]|uniref:Uncharacterized protein n=1 Tax=Flavobacterium agri TaxID=2743471 RepID=A0A7Y8XZR7_9FLAO|nr:hypothetical protein [Flavobacterium agri]NUY79765.1 hypothetical protein [Flavobacterium agri]NYA69790.1 hypothetical protein [Flavobacterium agri]